MGCYRCCFLRSVRTESVNVGKAKPEAEWDVDDIAACYEFCTSPRWCTTTTARGKAASNCGARWLNPCPDAGLAEGLDKKQGKSVDVGDDRFKACTCHAVPVRARRSGKDFHCLFSSCCLLVLSVCAWTTPTPALFYEPVGVVAAIVPWNYPLLMATWKSTRRWSQPNGLVPVAPWFVSVITQCCAIPVPVQLLPRLPLVAPSC